MGFFMFGNKGGGSSVDADEKVIQITSSGKAALSGCTVSGLEFDILETMKSGHPFTLDILLERVNEKNRRFVKASCNHLIHKKFLEIVNA